MLFLSILVFINYPREGIPMESSIQFQPSSHWTPDRKMPTTKNMLPFSQESKGKLQV